MSRFFSRVAVPVVLAAVGLIALGPAAAPVAAHTGGRSVVLVADLTLPPQGKTWTATTALVEAPVGKLAAGPVHLELKVRMLPGAEPVAPYNEAWDTTLVDGQPVRVASETGAGGGSNMALIASVAVAVMLIAVLYGLFSLRRRTAVPVPPR